MDASLANLSRAVGAKETVPAQVTEKIESSQTPSLKRLPLAKAVEGTSLIGERADIQED